MVMTKIVKKKVVGTQKVIIYAG